MKQIRGLDQWLTDDEEHQDWTWGELIKIGHMPSNVTDIRDFKIVVNEALNKLATTPDGHIYIAEIRKKWSRKIFADNKNNKTTSVTLSPSSLKQLVYLAKEKNKTKRQVLEEQLKFGAEIQKELSRQYKQALLDNKNELGHEINLLTNTKKHLEMVVKRKDDEIKKLRAEVKQQNISNISKYIK